MSKVYGSAPIKVAEIECKVDEMFFYQYLPIKLLGVTELCVPKRLINFDHIYTEIVNDFFNVVCDKDITKYGKYYIYLTAKRLFVTQGCGLNRDGWHTDGFGSEDINYVWCDSLPMKYVTGEWDNISQDHNESLKQFQQIGQSGIGTCWCEPNTIYRLDDAVIHSQTEYSGEPFIRTFVKVSFSKEKYNLKGNSHNYLLDYDWEMKERNVERNHPVK